MMLLLHASRTASQTNVEGTLLLPPELILEIVRRMPRNSVREEPPLVKVYERRVPKRTDRLFDHRPIMLRGWPDVTPYAF